MNVTDQMPGYQEFPGVAFFLCLFCISVAYFTFWPVGINSSGILLTFWGFFTALRVLWFAEAVSPEGNSPDKYQARRFLPKMILNAITVRKKRDDAVAVLRVFNSRFLLWLVFMVLFALLSIYTSFSPIFPAEYQYVETIMAEFLNSSDAHVSVFYSFGFQVVLINLAGFIITGLGFFLVQTYAHNKDHVNILLLLSLFLFLSLVLLHFLISGMADFSLMTFSSVFHGYGWGKFEIMQAIRQVPPGQMSPLGVRLEEVGLIAVLFLYLAGAVPAVIFMRGVFHGKKQWFYAALGLLVLGLLVLCDILAVHSEKILALWLSGWLALAVLWMKVEGQSAEL